jgi:hypothetical protein
MLYYTSHEDFCPLTNSTLPQQRKPIESKDYKKINGLEFQDLQRLANPSNQTTKPSTRRHIPPNHAIPPHDNLFLHPDYTKKKKVRGYTTSQCIEAVPIWKASIRARKIKDQEAYRFLERAYEKTSPRSFNRTCFISERDRKKINTLTSMKGRVNTPTSTKGRVKKNRAQNILF